MYKECGICDHWMKTSDCPLEAKGLKPDCGHPACNKFKKVKWAEDLDTNNKQ